MADGRRCDQVVRALTTDGENFGFRHTFQKFPLLPQQGTGTQLFS